MSTRERERERERKLVLKKYKSNYLKDKLISGANLLLSRAKSCYLTPLKTSYPVGPCVNPQRVVPGFHLTLLKAKHVFC